MTHTLRKMHDCIEVTTPVCKCVGVSGAEKNDYMCDFSKLIYKNLITLYYAESISQAQQK